MDEIQTDAKPQVEASSAATQQQAAPANQSSAQSEKEPTIAEVARQAYEESTQDSEKAEGSVQNLDTTEKKEEQSPLEAEAQTAPEEVQQETEKPKSDDPPPFHEHPRWKEMVSQRDEYKKQLDDVSPMLQAQKATVEYCQQHGVSVEQYRQFIELAALANTDPAKAREAMKPIWEKLSEYDGSVLPADLQARVDASDLKPEDAQELATLRAQARSREHQSRFAQQSTAQQVQQSILREVSSWSLQKQKLDPDFRPKQQGQPDGLVELVTDRYVRLASSQPPQTAADAVRLAEQAYSQVKDFFKSRTAQRPASRVMQSSRSSQQSTKVDPSKALTTRELVQQTAAQVARQHGIAYEPPSA